MQRSSSSRNARRIPPPRVEPIAIDPDRWMTWEEVGAAVGDPQLAATLLQQKKLPAGMYRPKSRDTLGRIAYEERWPRARVSLAIQDLRATGGL
jgi:hypothetical protein